MWDVQQLITDTNEDKVVG